MRPELQKKLNRLERASRFRRVFGVLVGLSIFAAAAIFYFQSGTRFSDYVRVGKVEAEVIMVMPGQHDYLGDVQRDRYRVRIVDSGKETATLRPTVGFARPVLVGDCLVLDILQHPEGGALVYRPVMRCSTD